MTRLPLSLDRASIPVSRFRPAAVGRFAFTVLRFALVLALLGFGTGALRAQEPPPIEQDGLTQEIDLPEEEKVLDEESKEFQPALWEQAQRFEEGKDDPSELAALSFGTNAVNTGLRYNQVMQKSAHNAYLRDEAVLDQLVYHRIRSLEFDIHNGKSGQATRNQDWFVYHREPFWAGTTCNRLSDCLNELGAFHLSNPYHEVITVFLDLKDSWESGRNPADLDARILAHIPSWSILKPADLLAACSGAWTLQASVQGSCNWPTLTSLRGKFLFVLTGGDVSSSNTPLNTYVGNGVTARYRNAFVAPEISSSSQILERDYVVFFNLDAGHKSLAPNVRAQNFESRIYGLNDAVEFFNGQWFGGNHLGTDGVNYHQDPTMVTHNRFGWPFQCLPGSTCPDTAEIANVVGVEVDSDDVWGSRDNFRFLYELNYSASNAYWRALVSTPNSHVEPWAKGCLMARSSTANNSQYFAVCRPADENRLRVQWRTSVGGGTSYQDGDIAAPDTVDPESVSYVQLLVYNAGKCAAGYGSQNGWSWTLIGYKCFSVPLQRQGIATSSHGGGTIKFLYTNLGKNGAPYSAYTFPYALSIGTVRGYWAFNGPFH